MVSFADKGISSPWRIIIYSADHCIDTIRQVLMCHPDDGLFLSYWIEGRVGPMADFNTMHKCKNFDAMMNWSSENAIEEELSEYPEEGEIIWTRKYHP